MPASCEQDARAASIQRIREVRVRRRKERSVNAGLRSAIPPRLRLPGHCRLATGAYGATEQTADEKCLERMAFNRELHSCIPIQAVSAPNRVRFSCYA
jgi:hypothetical protein